MAGRSARRIAGVLLATGLALPLPACVPADSEEPPRPFFLRAYCALRSFIIREDFRVHQEEVDPCAVEPPSVGDLFPQERESEEKGSGEQENRTR